MKTRFLGIFVLTVLYCGTFMCPELQARVCFPIEDDCNSSRAFFPTYSEPDDGSSSCEALGFKNRLAASWNSPFNGQTCGKEYVAEYCPHNRQYVKCCPSIYAYSQCNYPFVKAGQCGMRKACVCSDDFKFLPEVCRAGNATEDTACTHFFVKGVDENNKTFIKEGDSVTYYKNCRCDTEMYKYCETGITNCSEPHQTCNGKGQETGDDCCQSRGSDNNKYCKTCKCDDNYTKTESGCDYGVYLNHKESGNYCVDLSSGGTYKYSECCDCSEDEYPYESATYPGVKKASSCGCSKTTRYKAEECEANYDLIDGRCLAKCVDTILALTEYDPSVALLDTQTSYPVVKNYDGINNAKAKAATYVFLAKNITIANFTNNTYGCVKQSGGGYKGNGCGKATRTYFSAKNIGTVLAHKNYTGTTKLLFENAKRSCSRISSPKITVSTTQFPPLEDDENVRRTFKGISFNFNKSSLTIATDLTFVNYDNESIAGSRLISEKNIILQGSGENPPKFSVNRSTFFDLQSNGFNFDGNNIVWIDFPLSEVNEDKNGSSITLPPAGYLETKEGISIYREIGDMQNAGKKMLTIYGPSEGEEASIVTDFYIGSVQDLYDEEYLSRSMSVEIEGRVNYNMGSKKVFLTTGSKISHNDAKRIVGSSQRWQKCYANDFVAEPSYSTSSNSSCNIFNSVKSFPGSFCNKYYKYTGGSVTVTDYNQGMSKRSMDNVKFFIASINSSGVAKFERYGCKEVHNSNGCTPNNENGYYFYHDWVNMTGAYADFSHHGTSSYSVKCE